MQGSQGTPGAWLNDPAAHSLQTVSLVAVQSVVVSSPILQAVHGTHRSLPGSGLCRPVGHCWQTVSADKLQAVRCSDPAYVAVGKGTVTRVPAQTPASFPTLLARQGYSRGMCAPVWPTSAQHAVAASPLAGQTLHVWHGFVASWGGSRKDPGSHSSQPMSSGPWHTLQAGLRVFPAGHAVHTRSWVHVHLALS